MGIGFKGVCAAALLALVAGSADAESEGKLQAFEIDVNEHSEQARRYSENDYDENRSIDILVEALGKVMLGGMAYGGMASWERVDARGGTGLDLDPRTPGDPLLPLLRIDVTYQDVESDVDAFDVRAEGGYGPFGAHVNLTHYREDEPADDLDLVRILGLYRMSFGSHVQTDVGLGALIVDGRHTTGRFAFALPFLVHPSEYWGVEFRPTWAEHVRDYDLGLLLTRGHASLKAGYRWVDSPDESLRGPYLGLSLRL